MKKLSAVLASFAFGLVIMMAPHPAVALCETTVKDATVYIDRTKLTVNGNLSPSETVLFDGVLYIPISEAATQLGFAANWDKDSNTTTILKSGLPKLMRDDSHRDEKAVKSASLYFDRTKLIISGKPFGGKTLVYNDSLYIPISAAARELGLVAKWDSQTNTTNITTGRLAEVVAPDKYSVVGSFNDGLAQIQTSLRYKNTGLIDMYGNEIVTPKYDRIGDFEYGVALVEAENKYGYIDKTGREVVPVKYDGLSVLSNGLYSFREDQKLGLMDKSGNKLPSSNESGYSSLSTLKEGLIAASIIINNATLDRMYGYINESGGVVIPFRFDNAFDFFEGVAAVQSSDKWGLIDKNGQWLVQPTYEEVASPFKEGLTAAKAGGKWGVIDKTGKWIVSPQYARVSSFEDGIAKVYDSEDWESSKKGLIDKTGKEIVPPKYGSISDFYGDYATFSLGNWYGGKCGVIDRSGNVTVPPVYDFIDNQYEGKAIFRVGDYENGKYGFVDVKTGAEIIPPKYDLVGRFHNGYAKFGVGAYNFAGRDTGIEYGWDWGKIGYLDTTGNEIIPPVYLNAYEFSNKGVTFAEVDGDSPGEYKWRLIDAKGNVVCELDDGYGYVAAFNDDGFATVIKKYVVTDETQGVIVDIEYMK